MWAKDKIIYDDEGLLQGGPPSLAEFSFTIHPAVVKTDARLADEGGCARFGMDDGYFVGPRDIVFTILRDFADRIREETGGHLVPSKCKSYNPDFTATTDIGERSLLPEKLGDITEGRCYTTNGETYKRIMVFNAPIGEPEFVTEVLKDWAH